MRSLSLIYRVNCGERRSRRGIVPIASAKRWNLVMPFVWQIYVSDCRRRGLDAFSRSYVNRPDNPQH